MPKSILDEPRFRSEAAAYAYVEAQLWANGRICPKCGVVDRSGPLQGKSTRIGVYKCYACRKPFTVKVGTIFESSHVPLHIWLQAIHLMCSSKKGFSANQFSRILGVDLKTGWFIGHRIRLAMDESGSGALGGKGKTLEVDETFYGNKEGSPTWILHPEFGWQRKRGYGDKMKIVTLVERGGKARSVKTETVTAPEVRRVVLDNADTDSKLMTDEAHMYRRIGKSSRDTRASITGKRNGFAVWHTPTPSRASSDLQARHGRDLSALLRAAPSSLSDRVRFPVQQPD